MQQPSTKKCGWESNLKKTLQFWIIRALGPNVPEFKYQRNLFEELGMQQPPLRGNYLQPEYPNPDGDVRDFDKKQQTGLVEPQIDQYIDSMERPWKQNEFPEIASGSIAMQCRLVPYGSQLFASGFSTRSFWIRNRETRETLLQH